MKTKKLKLLDQVLAVMNKQNKSINTYKAYSYWMKKFIFFHNKRHPLSMGSAEAKAYLTYLAVTRKVSSSTQNQALYALLYLYREVLGVPLVELQRGRKAKNPKRVPIFLSQTEVFELMAEMRRTSRLMTELIYGGGLRVSECMKIRIQDIRFETNEILVYKGKGNKSRVTIFSSKVKEKLKEQVEFSRNIHLKGLLKRYGSNITSLHGGVEEFLNLQYLFPSERMCNGGKERKRVGGHYCIDTYRKQLAKAASRAEILKVVSPHALRHSFATHMIEAGNNIRVVQDLLGHESIRSTLIYCHSINNTKLELCSPLDVL